MTTNDLPVTEDELHAYVDGELPPGRVEAVLTWLGAHPDQAALVAGWRAQAESIRARYADVAGEPVPDRLKVETLMRPAAPLAGAGPPWPSPPRLPHS